MSSFTDPLDVRYIDGDTWKTLREFSFWTDCDDTMPEAMGLPARCVTCITVPAGQETDFASIPAALWSLVGHPAGTYVQASVLHDYIYRQPGVLVTRTKADAMFLEGMTVLGVSWWKRRLMWAGVRAFGAAAWEERA